MSTKRRHSLPIAKRLAALSVGESFEVRCTTADNYSLGEKIRKRTYEWRRRGLNRMSQKHSVIRHSDENGNYYLVTRTQ